MKKQWIAIASLAMVTFASGCGQAQQGGNANTNTNTNTNTGAGDTGTPRTVANGKIGGQITVLTNRTDLAANGQLNRWANQFKKLYPGVTNVNFEAIKDYQGTVKTRMNSGELGDVLFIPSGVPTSELPNFFLPLDSLGLDTKIYFNNYDQYQGKLYGIASGADVQGVVYNKAAFRKAGITAPPKTLTQFYTDCAKLKAKGILPIAVNYKDKWPLGAWDTLSYAVANNPNYVNSLVNTNTPFATSGAWAKSLGILDTLVKKKYTEPDLSASDWATSQVQLAKGKYAMMLLGQWDIPQEIAAGAKSSDIGFFPMPVDNSGKLRAVLNPDWVYAVSKNSRNVATAQAFVKFMLTQSNFADYAGFIPTVKTQKSGLPQLKAFLAMKPAMIQQPPNSDQFNKIANAAQIDFGSGGYIQQLLLAPSFTTGLASLNQRWAQAKQMG